VSDDNFLSRWSRRKVAARKGERQDEVVPAATPVEAVAPRPTAQPPAPPPLPPVESLTPESDFTPFMGSEVDPGLRRQALRTLFRDPRFNVMDGLDVYIDDYSKPDPIPADWLGKLNQMARLGDYRLPEDEPRDSESPRQDGEAPENSPQEQPVASEPGSTASDTSAAGAPASELKES